MGPTNASLRILVLEEREALKDVRNEQLERDLHAINGFLRSRAGQRTLIVWPCNTDGLQLRLTSLASAIGSDALLGINEEAFVFRGPAKNQFRKIAENTVATLNQGATLADLGVSEAEVENLIATSDTVGRLLGQLRSTINKKKSSVAGLLKKEQCKLWIVVAAGNEPDGDVAALTRGRYAAVDIERLMSSTEANIVKELKAYPDRLGILATVLDAKIFHLPMLAALDIVRAYAGNDLREKMRKANLSDKATKTTKPVDRLQKTELGRVFAGGTSGTLNPGGKPGSNTTEAFRKLAEIAQKSDSAINHTVGAALVQAGYVKKFETERDFGTGLTRCTDLYCWTDTGIVRVEMMWRGKAGRADIANYALGKLFNYGRAIGFLPDKV